MSRHKLAAAVRRVALAGTVGAVAALCLVAPAAADEVGPANPAPCHRLA